MRRRKKLIVAALVIVAAMAALLFWPRDHPEARQAFAAVRGLVEVLPEAEFVASASSAGALKTDAADKAETQAVPGGLTTPKPMAPPAPPIAAPPNWAPPRLAASDPEPTDPTPQVEINIAIVNLNLTDARTRLFAETVPNDKFIVGRVASPQSVLEILQALDVASIVSRPRIILSSGGAGRLVSGEAVVIPPAGLNAPLTVQEVGAKVDVYVKITGPDTVRLKFGCELSHIAGRKTVATPQGPVEQPDVKAVRASAEEELKTGEALFIGGLTQKAEGRVAFKAPYLGDLPGIGSWFCFTRQREFDEELVVLVTPRIIRPDGKASIVTQPRAVPKTPQILTIPLSN